MLLQNKRPLLWADRTDGPMLLDLVVAAALGGGGGGSFFSAAAAVTAADTALFEQAWAAGAPPLTPPGGNPQNGSSFDRLAAQAAPHLHFHWQSWPTKAACAAVEAAAAAAAAGNSTAGSVAVLGVDGAGKCVYWTDPAPPSPGSPRSWECMNDGSCAPAAAGGGGGPASAAADRVTFSSESQCLEKCARSWRCVRVTGSEPSSSGGGGDVPRSPRNFLGRSGLGYCLPSVGVTHEQTTFGPVFPDADACEVMCPVEDPGRDWTCRIWCAHTRLVRRSRSCGGTDGV